MWTLHNKMMSVVRTIQSVHVIKDYRGSAVYRATFGKSSLDASKFCYHYLPWTSGCKTKKWPSVWNTEKCHNKVLLETCLLGVQHYGYNSVKTSCRALQNSGSLKNLLQFRHASFPVCVNLVSINRAYSSHIGKNHDHLESPPASATGDSPMQSSDAVGNEWDDIFNRVSQSVVDAAVYTRKMAKEASDEVLPYINQLFDSHPYLNDIVIPIGWTLSASVLAWMMLPRLLRRFHHYAGQTPLALLSGKTPQGLIPYEKSFWGAVEDPARYLITFIAFSQLGVLIAPTTSIYLSQVWRGALVLSVIWFLQRWKKNVFSRALANQMTMGLDRDKLLALDKLSSVGLIILGMMAFAEACGVAVQSILTVGGIGGVATAFAARDILGNLLSGLSLQFSQPFSIGDNIKAGSIEGQVVEMGLTTTSLINQEKFPVLVPNSLFSSQVIVNKTRAQFRALMKTIPFCIDDLEKIPNVSESIKSMLKSHPAVVSGREAPYCFLSRIEDSYAELTIGCNLKNMRKDELYSTEQDILLQASHIIKQHGAKLGSTLNNLNGR
uniref:Mechanosensitive ion channel protein 1, mitochondrial n=1 Tax=Anthurium amnicola TaxID=1678845 RepID=A0A1D1ZJT1_9ARAE